MKIKETFVRKVTDTIKEYQMIMEGDRVIAGVSGGADSVCLLAILKYYQEQCPFQLMVVHVEHGLRGQESLEDAAFVEKLCQEWKIPCQVHSVDVMEQVRQTGQTMEEAARELRYRVFAQCCGELQAAKLAVAHNQNDQAETMLMNLARGSGLRGLGGILPVRRKQNGEMEYQIIRPLLFVLRAEIEDWLSEEGLVYRTDRTNLETEYTRNRLRIEILPKLEQEIHPDATSHIAEAALHLQKAEAYLQKIAREKWLHCVTITDQEATIDLAFFLQEDSLMQEYLLRLTVEKLLKGRGLKDYTAFHIEEMKRLAQMACGKQMDFPGRLQAVRRREELCLRKKKSLSDEMENEKEGWKQTEIGLSEPGEYVFGNYRFYVEYPEITQNMGTFPEKTYTKWLACDTMKDNVCLRTRKTGDYLIVNQDGGRKKLKDYMIDQKIPREERDQILVVAEGSHVLWVVGWRISEAAKVTAGSKRILKIQRLEEEV